MQKTNVNTVLVIIFLATAIMLIGGLAVIPTSTIQSASANHGERHGFGVGGGEHGGGGGGGVSTCG